MGIMKDILVFNTATPLESDNVGAYLRDSAGNLIDSTLIATKRWINASSATFDGSGNAISSTSGALNVNISSGMITTGIADKTTFVYGTGAEQPIGGVYQDTSPTLTAGQTGAVRLTANRGLHTNLRDSSGNELLGAKVSAASVPVVLASDQATLTVSANDAAQANTAVKASAVSVTSTAASVAGTALTGRKYLNIQNNGSVSIFVGDSAVTASTGSRVPPGATGEFRIGAGAALYALTSTGTCDVRVLELS